MSKITLQEYMAKPNIQTAIAKGRIPFHCECDDEDCQGWNILFPGDGEELGLKRAVIDG